MPGRKFHEATTGGSQVRFRDRTANAAVDDGMIHLDREYRDRFHEITDER